jgi:hypothetical protein
LYLRFRGLNNSTTFSDDSKGTAILSSQTYSNVTGITTGSGTGASFTILRIGGGSPSYSVTNIDNPGSDYNTSDTILIDGSVLGGVSGTNDLTLTVTGVDPSNQITSVTPSGTASNGNLSLKAIGGPDLNTINSGSGATFNISKNDSNYLAEVITGGTGYYPEYQLKILGSDIGGTSPTNDLTLSIQGIQYSGGPTLGIVTSVSTSGTPVVGDSIEFFPSVTIGEPTISPISTGTTVSFSSLARSLTSL